MTKDLDNPPVWTKRQLSDQISELYKQVAIKQKAVAEVHDGDQKIWDGYDEVMTHLQRAGKALIQVGGIDP